MFRVIHKYLLIGLATVLTVSLFPGFSFAITWTPNFSSATHTVSQSSTNTSVTVSWDAMTPTGGTSAGSYAYVWDNTSDTTIPATVEQTATISGNVTATTVTRTLTPDGSWYLHMRARDSGGNWTNTYHFGPIIIDTTPSPTVTNISPTSGVNSNDTVIVTITGTRFKKLDDSDFSSITAKIGTTTLSNLFVVSSTSITASYAVKNKTAGLYSVTVTTDWGTSEPLTDAFTVSNPAPTVSSVSPTSGGNGTDRTVTITGTGFLSTSTTPPGTANPTVQMKDPDNSSRNFTLTNPNVVSKTSMTATVPAGKTPGTYDVVVTNSDSQSGTLTDGYQVKLPAPTITSVSPASGTNEKTTSITITGTNFQTTGTTLVTLEAEGKDTISCTKDVNSSTEIVAVVPANKTIGTYDVKVTNPDSQYVTKADAFTVNNPVPTVTSITPASMTNNASQPVTVEGTNFRSGITVKIGTNTCTGPSLDGATPSTKLTCTVPAGIDPGTYNVTATNVGTDPGTLTNGFTVNAATTTVALTYSASDTSAVPAGDLTITATFSQTQSAAPSISIDQQGSTDVTDADMTATADSKIWTYVYAVQSDNGTEYVDGDATVTIKSSGGTNISITNGSTFTIDTASLSAGITYDQDGNTSGPFMAGDLTITVTLNNAVTSAPKISINQQGSTDITDDNNLLGSGTTWDYTYTIQTKDGVNYKDGLATVSLKDSDNADATIPIGSGGTFSIDTTSPTVALTYAQGGNTGGPFKAGNLTITATFSENPSGTPQIAIDQAGTTDVSAIDMTATGSAKVWNYVYTVTDDDGSAYVDGVATVTITNGADSAGNANQAATNNTFTTDTSTTMAINAVTSPTTNASQVITGTKESGATVSVSVTNPVTAGSVIYPNGTTWSCTISNLQEQANDIVVTATDAAGNTAQDTTSITYDGTPPQVVSATYVDTTHVDVTFSEAVSGGTTASRYTISGLTVSSATDQGSNTYRLTTSTTTTGQVYTVVVSTTITDLVGNALDSNNNSAQYSSGVKGDVNGDGEITSQDAVDAFYLQFTAWGDLTALQQYTADYNSNGEITAQDAVDIFYAQFE